MVAERSVEERISERICERIEDVRVPRMAEQVIEASQISSQSRVLEGTIGQTLDVPVPEMAEQLVEALKIASWDRTMQRTVEHTSDIPVSQVVQISEVFSQDRVQQRSVEQAVEIPTISLAGEIIEMLVIQTKEKTRQVADPQIQHVFDTVDVQNHIIQKKIDQMTKHAPRMQDVEKTVEEHFAVLVQLASRIRTSLKFGDETGEDPFEKVKSLITELIDQLQDTLERLSKNQLAENDELGFGQACGR